MPPPLRAIDAAPHPRADDVFSTQTHADDVFSPPTHADDVFSPPTQADDVVPPTPIVEVRVDPVAGSAAAVAGPACWRRSRSFR